MSVPGSNSVSRPYQLSETMGVAHAAASNRRTLGLTAGPHHVGPGDVQRPAAGCVERGVVRRPDMIQPLHVGRPVDIARVLRPGHDEAQVRQPCGRLQQEALKDGLPVWL